MINKILWSAVNNNQQWRWLVVILEGIGVPGLQLGDVKYTVYSNSAGEAESK